MVAIGKKRKGKE
jgi:hypothetical protein